MSTHSLRISRLVEHDFMRIRALDIQPGRKSLVVLKGPNEQGKTSALRALISALTGKRADPDEPIRKGEDKATVELTLADDLREHYRVQVSWTPSGRYLTVYQLDDGGELKLNAGQSVLNALIGDLSYSPTAFLSANRETRLKMLLSAIGQADAWEKNRARYKALYDQRTENNREIRHIQAKLAQNPDPAPDRELVHAPLDELRTQLETAQKHNEKIAAFKTKLEAFDAETERLVERRDEVSEQIARLTHQLADLENQVTERREKSAKAHDQAKAAKPIDVEQTLALIQQRVEHNNQAERQRRARTIAAKLQERQQTVARLEEEMRQCDRVVEDLIAQSDLPKQVPGLKVSANGEILHNDLPIEQASGMRMLELSCLIGMAANPTLRVMTIDEGDKLDEQAMNRLVEIAQQHNYQVWMASIYAGDEASDAHIVHMLDGAAAGTPPPPPPPPQRTTRNKRNTASIASDDDVAAMYGDARPQTSSGPSSRNAEPVDLEDFDL